MALSQDETVADQRILIISRIGCGPPFSGSRSRMVCLLEDLRQLGFRIHFAGVCLSKEEREATSAHVDEWIHDFTWLPQPRPALVRRMVRRFSAAIGQAWRRLGGFLSGREKLPTMDLDQWFHPDWLAQTREIQQVRGYRLVLVSYVIHSAFFKAFDDQCLKILDCHDVFTERNEMLRRANVDPKGYWISLSRRGERKGLLRADVILGIQDVETRFFEKLTAGRRVVRTVGHFIGCEPLPFKEESVPSVGYLASGNPLNQVGFQWFLDEVWPMVNASGCPGQLLVAGGICESMVMPADARVLGIIDSLEAFYGAVLLSINPMTSGTGLKIKTVESLAHGRAIITTPSGVEGMAPAPGITVAASAADFASALIAHLRNPLLTQQSGTVAAEWMRRQRQGSREVLMQALCTRPSGRA